MIRDVNNLEKKLRCDRVINLNFSNSTYKYKKITSKKSKKWRCLFHCERCQNKPEFDRPTYL